VSEYERLRLMVGLGGMDLGVGGGPMAPGGAAAARETMFRGGDRGVGILDGVDISLGIVRGDYGGCLQVAARAGSLVSQGSRWWMKN
jgi:hypothetical protein